MGDPNKKMETESVTAEEGSNVEVTETVESTNTEVDQKARCAAIIAAPEAKGRTELAQHLAFETDLDVTAAIGVLKTSPDASVSSDTGNQLDTAMASIEQPNISAMGEDSEQSEASQFVASYKKVVGDK